jgi:hypothetical protein
MKIVFPERFSTIEVCEILDSTFSDTDRYPSLVEFEVVRLVGVTKTGMTELSHTYEVDLDMDEYLPRLKALGVLPASRMRGVGFVRPIESFGSAVGDYCLPSAKQRFSYLHLS